MSVAFLFVTCCLEPTRSDVLKLVVQNFKETMPEILDKITVFDNSSTQDGTLELLKTTFSNVYVANQNVGYWSAVDWWLNHIEKDKPEFTYIIESDMIHYAFDKIWTAANYLRENQEIGSVRLHEYSVENWRLYNKDVPVQGSKKNIWQSHTNKITHQPINVITPGVNGICVANFLTQLPALNRYATMRHVFARLRSLNTFSEVDFQKFYHDEFQVNSILDGGIFHCDPGSFGSRVITGSWSSVQDLTKVGYHETRNGMIFDRSKYTVTKLE